MRSAARPRDRRRGRARRRRPRSGSASRSRRAADLVARARRSGAPPQRQHRAAREVEHRAVLLVDGADAQHGEAGRRRPSLTRFSRQRDDLGRRAQRVAEPHRAPQQQPAVEEVRRPRAGSPASTGRSRRPRPARDARAARPRRPPPRRACASSARRRRSPGDRLVQRGVALGERERGGVREHGPDLQILEPRRSRRPGRGDAHRPAPARASTRRADSASASSSMRSSTPTAPAPSAAAASSAASTSRASAISSSVGVNASRSASSCAGWIAHLPSKPSVARVHHGRAELVVVADAQVRPVDRLDAGRARGDEHGLLRIPPVLAAPAPPVRPSEAARSA